MDLVVRQDGTYTAKGRSVATIRCRPRGDAHLKGKGWVAVAMTTKPHPPTHQEGGGWVVSERRHLCVVDGVGSWSPWTLAGYLFFPLKKKKITVLVFFLSLSLSLSLTVWLLLVIPSQWNAARPGVVSSSLQPDEHKEKKILKKKKKLRSKSTIELRKSLQKANRIRRRRDFLRIFLFIEITCGARVDEAVGRWIRKPVAAQQTEIDGRRPHFWLRPTSGSTRRH